MVSDRKKRWLIITQYYPPEIGAPQIRLRSVVGELRRAGFDVEVLTAFPNYPKGELFEGYSLRNLSVREEIDGVPVHRVWIYPGTGRNAFIRLLNYFSFTFTAMLAALFGKRPDYIFLESQPLSLGVVGLLMKWLRRVPYVYNVPDLQVDVARQLGFIKNETFLRFAFWLEDRFLKNSWKVSTVTHRFIQHFEERGVPRSQISYLPNGADPRFLQPMDASEVLIARWGLQGKKVFAYVGTHAYYHGLDTLIEAADLLKNDESIGFLMVGDGPERQRLITKAESLGLGNVVFGQSPYEEMAQLYSISYAATACLRDVEVANQMRLSKIFPALSCGVPVIYSGRGEAADMIVEQGCGIVTKPEDPLELAEAIRALASDPARRDELGKTGRAMVEAEYSWQAIVEAWLAEIGLAN